MTSNDLVVLDDGLAEPLSENAVLAGVVRGAVETLAMLAEHRWMKTMRERRWREQRIRYLWRAIVAAGPGALDLALAIATRMRADGDPWALWAACSLSARLGHDAATRLENIAESASSHVETRIVAEAIAVARPAVAVASRWAQASSPALRAVAVGVLHHLGVLTSERLAIALRDVSALVVCAALRALRREAPAKFGDLVDHEDVEVADLAGRALIRAGDPTPLALLRDRPALRRALAERAVEWIALGGESGDLELISEISRGKPSRELLSGLGRCGNPLVGSYLIHYVADAALGDSAQGALCTLFGELVPPEHRDETNAWRVAIAARRWDPNLRLRRGEPWSPRVVVGECLSPEISAREVILRLEELTARVGATTPMIDFGLFRQPTTQELERLLSPLATLPYRSGSWGRR